MAKNKMKLELILMGKDLLSKVISKNVGLLKQFSKAGTEAAKVADKLDAARKKSAGAATTAANAAKKEAGELKKLGSETDKAAKSEEKLNKARKKRTSGGDSTKKEVDDTKKLGAAAEKAAKSEEKLNAAIKNRPRRTRRGAEDLPTRRTRKGSEGNPENPDNSRELLDDAALTGAGTSGLFLAKKGLTGAMSQQEAFADLYNTFYRKNLNPSELNSQMKQAEKLAIELGNALPGTTTDFVNMLSAMKEYGLESKVVLAAGKDTAYLAVTNKEDPTETGKGLAQYGTLWNLKTEDEYHEIADLMSRYKTAHSIGTNELIEMSKYFGGRTGTGLGMTGIKGAKDSLQLLAFLRQNTALESTMIGEGTSSFFREYLKAKQGRKKTDPLGDIQKLTGQKIDLFDSKGQFVGSDKMMEQLAKLKGKLTPEQLTGIAQKLSGDSGGAIFTAMVDKADKWKESNADIDSTIGLQEKQARNAENLTQKFEALLGSLENLGAEGFKPLLKDLGRITDAVNSTTGSLTDLAKANPGISSLAARVLTLGSAFMLWKGGSGLVSRFFQGATGEVQNLSRSVTQAENDVGRLGTKLSGMRSVGTIALKVGALVGLEYAIESAVTHYLEMKDAEKAAKENRDKESEDFQATKFVANKEGKRVIDANPAAILREGEKVFKYFNRDDNELVEALKGESFSKSNNTSSVATDMLLTGGIGNLLQGWDRYAKMTGASSYRDITGLKDFQPLPFMEKRRIGNAYVDSQDQFSAQNFGKQAVGQKLWDPNVMAGLLYYIRNQAKLPQEPKQKLEGALQKEYGSSYIKAEKMLPSLEKFAEQQQGIIQSTNQVGISFSSLVQPLNTVPGQFGNLSTNSESAIRALANMTDAASGYADRINNLEIKVPTITSPGISNTNNSSRGAGLVGKAPTKAKGGTVMREGFAYVHSGEDIMPANITREYRNPKYLLSQFSDQSDENDPVIPNDVLQRRQPKTFVQSPAIRIENNFHFTLPGGGEVSNKTKQDFEAICRKVVREELDPDRLAAKVAYAASKRSERS